MEMIQFGLLYLLVSPILCVLGLILVYIVITRNYIHFVARIFQEKPLFIIPKGDVTAACESIRFPTSGGLMLQGCYFETAFPRKGVILFGLEFSSNRFSSIPYCEWLVTAGYDVFIYEPRNQGDSDKQPDYEPLHWITQYEVDDTKSAIAYLKTRPDADPNGIGFFGISKGAASGLYVGADDPYILCSVSDGVFGTYTTMVPFMRQWICIYSKRAAIHTILPYWFFGKLALDAIKIAERERAGNAKFLHLESKIRKMTSPWFMIHGVLDTYIKPEMARTLFKMCNSPKKLWVVPGARHNMAMQVAPEEYKNRVLNFFDSYLASVSSVEAASKQLEAVVSSSK